jgi:hypothetical protein
VSAGKIPESFGRPGKRAGGRRLPGCLIGVVLAALGITLDHFALGRVEWAVALAIGTGAAISIRWSSRDRRWFLPSVGAMIAASIAISLFVGWPFPPGEAAGGLFVMIIVCAVGETALLSWMGWLFEVRATPRTRQNIITEVVLYGFVALIVALIGFLIWVVKHAEAENQRLAQVVMTEKSDRSASDLRSCLDPARHGSTWSDMPGVTGGKRMYDVNRGDGIIVIDQGTGLLVQVMTKRGRPLRKDELERVRKCLDGDRP